MRNSRQSEILLELVFCLQNCSDLLTVRKNCSSDLEQIFPIQKPTGKVRKGI